MSRQAIRKQVLEETRKTAIAYYKYIYSDRKYLGENKMYLRELHFLTISGENQDMTMTEISDSMGISQGAVSQIAKRLLNKGLIEKVKREDNRRITQIVLTEEGKRLFEQYKRFDEERHNEVDLYFQEFSEEDFETIIRYERLVRDVCEGRIAENTLPK